MHILMMLAMISVAVCLRWQYTKSAGSWQKRWQYTLFLFLFPSLTVLTTVISIICMGTQGQMLGIQTGWLSYSLALGFLTYALGWGIILISQARRSQRKLLTCPQVHLIEHTPSQVGRLIDSPQPFAAKIGFWRTELVITQGMLNLLDVEHLNAVLKHEEAHDHYHDTFWFFGLGYIRQITAWLPNTEALWQELLILRELRADYWASQYVDKLILAESLLWSVSSSSVVESDILCTQFSHFIHQSRLEERVDALLSETELENAENSRIWYWGVLTLSPLLSVLLHT